MISSSQIYVVFDHVQFERKSWQQRNRIKDVNGVAMLTIPVSRGHRGTRICDIRISYDQGNPLANHWERIERAYRKARFFDRYAHFFKEIYGHQYTLLRDLNVDLIKVICGILGISVSFVLSSQLDLNEIGLGRTEKIVQLCKILGITHLYDAGGAQVIIEKPVFQAAGIGIEFQEFVHPTYRQLWGPFIPYLSVVDLIFNEGNNSMDVIRRGKVRNSPETFTQDRPDAVA